MDIKSVEIKDNILIIDGHYKIHIDGLLTLLTNGSLTSHAEVISSTILSLAQLTAFILTSYDLDGSCKNDAGVIAPSPELLYSLKVLEDSFKTMEV